MLQKIKFPIYRDASAIYPTKPELLEAQEAEVSHVEIWKGMSSMDFYDQLPKDLRSVLQQTAAPLGYIFNLLRSGKSVEEVIDFCRIHEHTTQRV